MDSTPKVVAASAASAGAAVTPSKQKCASARSKISKTLRYSENVNPNESSPDLKSSRSPPMVQPERSAKKSGSKNPILNQVARAGATPSPKKKIRERKFVIAKRKLRNEEQSSLAAGSVACEKCKKAIGKSKCLCVAYENLRASQEEFFKNRGEIEDEVSGKLKEHDVASDEAETKLDTSKALERKTDALSEINSGEKVDGDPNNQTALKRSRDKLLEETRRSVMALTSGRVMNLVKEFEKLTVLKHGSNEEVEGMKDFNDKIMNWEMLGLQQPAKASELQVSSSSFSPSDLFLTSESLGLDPQRSYSLDSNQGSFSISSSTSAAGQKPRRKSTESSGNRLRKNLKKKQAKATSLKPFMLKTEERGRWKEEEFMKKLQKMIEEEEKMRIPMAQGLPWTTDEPECLVKPTVKGITRPLDLVLHSGMRAMERSEFDHQVALKMNFIEQYRMGREKQLKMEEEEEIRRLRKELVPKAQPMPYFDRPFIPQRSMRQPTVPKEPKFHIPEHKKIKCHLSLDGLCSQQQHY